MGSLFFVFYCYAENKMLLMTSLLHVLTHQQKTKFSVISNNSLFPIVHTYSKVEINDKLDIFFRNHLMKEQSQLIHI